MRLIKSVGQKLVINEDSEIASSLGSCYRRTCDKCKEVLPMLARPEQHVDEKPSGSFLRISNLTMPIIAVAKPAATVPPTAGQTAPKKHPKFPSRQRHLAIKRKKSKPKRLCATGEDNADEEYDEDDDEIESVQTEEKDLAEVDEDVDGCDKTISCNGDCSSET